MKAAIDVCVSTLDQNPENQLAERRYIDARVAGKRRNTATRASAALRTSALRSMRSWLTRNAASSMCLLVWKMDRLGRVLHLVMMLDELQTLGIAFVSLGGGHRLHNPGWQASDAHPCKR